MIARASTLKQALYAFLGTRGQWVCFLVILALGIFARTWEFVKVPDGINLDEASIGVDAYDIYKFGIDRNGVSYPTHFISFGQEQNTLYGYVLIPFIAALGLKTAVVRLPMLIAGILTLPLVFWVARHGFGSRVGFLSMFFVAISPWHILLSRYGLDVNFFPFAFVLAYACLLKACEDNRWFLAACILFGLCFYSYGPAYLIVPVVLAGAAWMLSRRAQLKRAYLVPGLLLFVAVIIPCGIFLLINALGLQTVHLGPVTIPRLPVPARFLSTTDEMRAQPLQLLWGNLLNLVSLLVTQSDGLIYNVYPPFGYFYVVTFPWAVFGILLLLQRKSHYAAFDARALLLWLGICALFGILEFVNINRLNVVFIPLLVAMAVAVDWLATHVKLALEITVLGLLAAFGAFTIAYHSRAYADLAAAKFRPGLLAAIEYASSLNSGPVCVTDEPGFPYIYVLFVDKTPPSDYLSTIKYAEVTGTSRYVLSLPRYTFGKGNCALTPPPTYVLKSGELPPQLGNRYAYKFFDEYVVYYVKGQ